MSAIKLREIGIVIIVLFVSCCKSFAQGEFNARYNKLRTENDLKFKVPAKMAGPLWQYLKAKYGKSNLEFKKIDEAFKYRTEEELFFDQYFDTKNFELFKSEIGLRHRKRHILSDTSRRDSPQDLVELKINIRDSGKVRRGQYNFPVKRYEGNDAKIETNTVQSLVKKKHRAGFVLRLKEYNIEAKDLLPTIEMDQRRKRIYIYKDSVPFVILTLDYISATYKEKSTKFIEFEFKLNEMDFVKSDKATMEALEKMRTKIAADIIKKFPGVKQDQTPKYNKAAVKFGLAQKS